MLKREYAGLQHGIKNDDLYVTFGAKSKPKFTENIDEIMKKSVITDNYEKQFTVLPYIENRKQLAKKRRIERDKTKGSQWFDLPATEITEEVSNDLNLIQMRRALDPKHHYKKADLKVIPKYFQMGTIIEGKQDFYSGRVPKKERKRTIAEELLADLDFTKYRKRKIGELKARDAAIKRRGRGARQHAKKLKKKK